MKLSLLSLVFLASGLQAAQVSVPSATEMALAGANKPTKQEMSRGGALPTTFFGWVQESRDFCELFMQAVALPKECRQAAWTCVNAADSSALAAYVASAQAKKNN